MTQTSVYSYGFHNAGNYFFLELTGTYYFLELKEIVGSGGGENSENVNVLSLAICFIQALMS